MRSRISHSTPAQIRQKTSSYATAGWDAGLPYPRLSGSVYTHAQGKLEKLDQCSPLMTSPMRPTASAMRRAGAAISARCATDGNSLNERCIPVHRRPGLSLIRCSQAALRARI